MEKPVSRSGYTDLPFRLVRIQVDLLEVARASVTSSACLRRASRTVVYVGNVMGKMSRGYPSFFGRFQSRYIHIEKWVRHFSWV
jgi:hypothetical protein